jgi:hypothetical protein
VGRVAAGQFGRVSAAQLAHLGVARSTIGDWRLSGYLFDRLPRVYAVGHPAPSVESSLIEAVLYAGPGEMLGATSAAHWLGLIRFPPRRIQVVTPRRCRSLTTVDVQNRRPLPRIWHNGIPTTTIPQTMLDLATAEELIVVRHALAQLDYRRQLDLDSLEAACGPGRAGTAMLRRAMRDHQPALALTKSPLEILQIEVCERYRLPIPEINAWIHDIEVDALWRNSGLVVELDGGGNHGTWAQIKRDRKNELTLRSHGLTVQRYTDEQMKLTPEAGAEDIRARL